MLHVFVFVFHHHEDAGDGHEDVGDGDHRLVCGDGQSHGGGGVGDQHHGEREREEGFSCRLQTCRQVNTYIIIYLEL